ncbi:MAG: DUF4139 domain-containing protein [Treponema sp.]|jgi:hypothetical protein|nr:DUF4139 domain-containing protein [Treponema sp.]
MTRPYFALVIGAIFFTVFSGPRPEAQPLRDGESLPLETQAGAMPLRKITVYSSGVAFFEHSRVLSGPAVFRLPFTATALNDALKSLLLRDPASAFPLIGYSPEQGLPETLRSLGVDLSGNPGMAEILENLRGEEVEVNVPEPIRGRIMALEYRRAGDGGPAEPWLSLLGPQGIRLLNLAKIDSLRVTNADLNADLERALDLIMASRNSRTRELTITLPGGGSRSVSVSYVIPSPVWKVSYRLDLGNGTSAPARFQGWAIVDNDSDEDWRDVELSLAAGRPVSFIQNLYPPYYQDRPTLPLAIAGSAAPVTYAAADSRQRATLNSPVEKSAAAEELVEFEPSPRAAAPVPAPEPLPVTGADMADQFSFTLSSPVSIDRKSSVMFPLSDTEISVRKFLIFSGVQTGRTVHPAVGAELNNTTGLRLPAGPITVYDGGSYAGDALLEFLNRDEKRLISWGEDLSVTGTSSVSSTRIVTAVTVSGGVMTLNRRQSTEKTYRFRNTGPEAKTIVIEHPITTGAALAEPANYDEATGTAYRFIRQIPPGTGGTGEAELRVREETPLSQRISLTNLTPAALLSYSSSQEIPAAVRTSLAQAVELWRGVEDAEKARTETEARKNAQAAEQDRIRGNLEAAGNETPQGQEYLRRLTALDAEIDRLNGDLERQRAGALEAQAAYENYLRNLSF